MANEISVPDERAPGQAVAVRAPLRRAGRGGHPLITADAATGQPLDGHDRVGALVRGAGIAA